MGFSIQQLYRNYVVALSVALVLLLTASLTFSSFLYTRASLTREVGYQAKMIASELSERDGASLTELKRLLNRASVNNSLELACLLNDRGAIRASILGAARDDGASSSLICDAGGLATLGLWHVYARAAVTDEALPKPIGEVVLIAAAPSVHKYFLIWLTFAILVGLLFGAICWLFGLKFERTLLKPIRQIATTAQRVSLYKDYSLRVAAGALEVVPQEIEALTDSFNAMLHEIEDRDTRLTRKSEELEKSRRSAESASLAKSQFLANVSHELRTPLNAIIGFSTMIENAQFGPLGHEKYAEYAHDIHDSGKHLLDVINDILDITKAESGTLSVKFEAVSLHKIIEKALNIVAGQAHERKVDVYTDVPEKLPKIYGDRVRLVQILLNLLSNAIKFTGEGGKVIIRARAEAGKNGVHYFTIEIEDTGIGMSDVEINKAFAAFNQSDAGLNRKYEGAGLGLPLTKRLVELHHGKIKINSKPGVGTTVTVRLTSDPALLE